MTDTLGTDTAVTPAASPAPAPAIDYDALARAIARVGGAPAQPPAPAPAKPVAETNLFQKGQLVTHSHFDRFDRRTRTRYGIVVSVLANEGAGARSIVAWFDGVSGPIGDEELEGA